jgi:hypothetical protein
MVAQEGERSRRNGLGRALFVSPNLLEMVRTRFTGWSQTDREHLDQYISLGKLQSMDQTVEF